MLSSPAACAAGASGSRARLAAISKGWRMVGFSLASGWGFGVGYFCSSVQILVMISVTSVGQAARNTPLLPPAR